MKSLMLPLLLLAAIAPAAPSWAQAPAESLSVMHFDGIWLFDAAHSDDPMKVMDQQGLPGGRRGMRGAGGPPGGMEGGGGGRRGGMGGEMGPGGRGGHGGPPGGEGGEADSLPGETNSRGGGDPRRAFDRVMHPARKMVVYVDRDRFQVEEDEGPPRVYTLADSLRALGVNPLHDEATVRLVGRRLEAKQPLGRRGALLESYELSADGRRLTIRAQRVGGPEGRPNAVFTRSYVKYDGE